MKASPNHLWKNFAAKIHPQAPLTQIESNRLLGALKTSFRAQLDPNHSDSATVSLKAKTTTSSSQTERHIASVLTNPLLIKHVEPSQQYTSAASGPRHPIEVLSHSISNGTATLRTVRQCLVAFKQSLRAMNAADRTKTIVQHKAGTKTLQWLWANDLANSAMFESDLTPHDAVLFYLWMEGRLDAIWNWINAASAEQTILRSVGGKPESPKSILLASLISLRLAAKRSGGIDSAARLYLKAVADSTAAGSVDLGFTRLAGSHVLAALLDESQQESALLQSTTIKEFAADLSRWQPSKIQPLEVDRVRLLLRISPSTAINEALHLATLLDLENARSSTDRFGAKVAQLLISLSDAIAASGTRNQARQLIRLLRRVEQEELQHDDQQDQSILSSATGGITALLLHDLKLSHVEAFQDVVPG